jgi:hypothetical protein
MQSMGNNFICPVSRNETIRHAIGAKQLYFTAVVGFYAVET